MKEKIKVFIKENLCVEKQVEVGPISVLLCDLMLSFNLKGPDVLVEGPDGNNHNLGPSITYGITIEPFAIHLMGRDGDICWSSPGWSLVDWVFLKKKVSVGYVSDKAPNEEATVSGMFSSMYEFQLGT